MRLKQVAAHPSPGGSKIARRSSMSAATSASPRSSAAIRSETSLYWSIAVLLRIAHVVAVPRDRPVLLQPPGQIADLVHVGHHHPAPADVLHPTELHLFETLELVDDRRELLESLGDLGIRNLSYVVTQVGARLAQGIGMGSTPDQHRVPSTKECCCVFERVQGEAHRLPTLMQPRLEIGKRKTPSRPIDRLLRRQLARDRRHSSFSPDPAGV